MCKEEVQPQERIFFSLLAPEISFPSTPSLLCWQNISNKGTENMPTYPGAGVTDHASVHSFSELSASCGTEGRLVLTCTNGTALTLN